MTASNGRVALVTGAARGQGRSHAVRLAAEGYDVIGVDICAQIPQVPYPMSTPEDLEATGKVVADHDRRWHPLIADVRDYASLAAGVDAAVGDLGRLDVVVANAGICMARSVLEPYDAAWWQNTVDVNLTGVWNTVKSSLDHLLLSDAASVVLISSTAGVRGLGNLASYTAAKHGVVGLCKTLAIELAEKGIRVNSILPGPVRTPMNNSDMTFRLMRPDLENPTEDDAAEVFRTITLLDTPWLEPSDISDAVAWLAGPQSRYVTGISLSIDAGAAAK